ncbi:NAD-dependent epimerase/dehydratase family protein [Micromonospora sp. RP3T]|uniref:NAD-dependent epimerase/dehydratase family protein n=1 Tax=Micromonospora sp. RP3T TaxID=2135446 RepID=UPI003D719DED
MSARWLDAATGPERRSVAIIGGAGRLGTRLTEVLHALGFRVTVVDVTPPAMDGVEFVACDIRAGRLPSRILAGADTVVHLAALHGPHLTSGATRRDFWSVNVLGTQAVLAAARAADARFVLASSTSLYGPGTAVGQPCRVLDERTPPQPTDVYDLTKLAAEALVRDARAAGHPATILRLGRFFFGSRFDYHLRKLSTGLDVWDACQAFVRVVAAPQVPSPLYCVVSDLELPLDERRRLGTDLVGVLRRRHPRIVAAAHARGIVLPSRVGKTVVTDTLRHDLGYLPERDLGWVADRWTAPARSRIPAHLLPPPTDVAPADLFPLTT